MSVGDAHVFLGFLMPILTQFSFQSHQLFFSHASEVRGKNYAGKKKKACLNRVSNSQPPGHESDMLTTESSGRATKTDVDLDLYIVRKTSFMKASSRYLKAGRYDQDGFN